MVDAKFHFGTLRYLSIMYTILFTYVAHYLNNNRTGLKLLTNARVLRNQKISRTFS